MSRRHADNWSHPGHYLVDPWTWPWSSNGHGHGHEWPIAFVQCQSALPFWDTAISKFDHENPWSRSCVWSKVKVTFDLQNTKVKVMAKFKPDGHTWGLGVQSICLLFRFVAIGPFLAEVEQILYLTLKIQGQGHDENCPKSNQVIYRSGPIIVPKMKEIWKVVQKLLREQESAAGGGGGGGGVRTGIPGWLN